MPKINYEHQLSQSSPFDHGSDKDVYRLQEDLDSVLYKPRGWLAKKNLEKEVRIAQAVKKHFEALGNSPTYLAIDLTNVSSNPHNIIVKAQFAEKSNLNDYLNSTYLPLDTCLELGSHLIQGLGNLHSAGYLSNDLKPENILVFNEQNKPVAKISDFGKAAYVGDHIDTVVFASGNGRFVAPEKVSTKKGEVFSMALIMLRVFEEHFHPDLCDDLASTNKNGKGGIEGLLLLNGRSYHKGISGRVIALIKYLAAKIFGHVSLSQGKREEKIIHAHIQRVFSSRAYRLDPKVNEAIAKLRDLLIDMTKASPKDRPSTEEAKERYLAAMNDILKAEYPWKLK